MKMIFYVYGNVWILDRDTYFHGDFFLDYRPEGGRLFDMKVVSSYVFLRTHYVITNKGNVLLFKKIYLN